jgi:hypothetical protein
MIIIYAKPESTQNLVDMILKMKRDSGAASWGISRDWGNLSPNKDGGVLAFYDQSGKRVGEIRSNDD